MHVEFLLYVKRVWFITPCPVVSCNRMWASRWHHTCIKCFKTPNISTQFLYIELVIQKDLVSPSLIITLVWMTVFVIWEHNAQSQNFELSFYLFIYFSPIFFTLFFYFLFIYYFFFKHTFCVCSHFSGDCHALHASRLPGESAKVHRQGSYATRKTQKWVWNFMPWILLSY